MYVYYMTAECGGIGIPCYVNYEDYWDTRNGW
jgi:hypothetical protein